MEKFGIEVYPWFSFSDFGKEFPGYNKDLKKEKEKLDKEKRDNYFSSQPQNIAYWLWIVIISIISLIVLGSLMVRKQKKQKNNIWKKEFVAVVSN